MAKAALSEAARLGAMAVEETGFGIADDKARRTASPPRTSGTTSRACARSASSRETKDVVEIASPRGVVAGIIPSTNPTSTAIFKCLISIKSRNAIVLSPHPSAARCINETVKVVRDAAVKEGLPADAIGCMTSATIEGTEALMKHKQTAVILATGGIGLVRAAYSSGKPAFGVGPGNVPAFVERTADVAKAAQDILTGTCFDNGTICASEQAVVADAPIEKALREQFKAQGAHFLSASEADQLAKVVATPQRSLNPAIVGKSAEHIAKLAGISIPPGTRCLIADVGGVGRDHPLSMEKLSPLLAFYVVDGIEQGAARCFEILSYGGMGHTAGVHTRSRDAAVSYGREMPASRVIVNSPTTHGAIGFSTALPPSMTLGLRLLGRQRHVRQRLAAAPDGHQARRVRDAPRQEREARGSPGAEAGRGRAAARARRDARRLSAAARDRPRRDCRHRGPLPGGTRRPARGAAPVLVARARAAGD